MLRSSHSVAVTPGRANSIAEETLRKLSHETFKTSDFDGFTSRPMSESIEIIRRRSSQTLCSGLPIVASSKYQMVMGDLTLLAILSTAKANRIGKSGSPCWTPVSVSIVSLPITRWLLVAYAVDSKRRIDGVLVEQTSRK